MIILSASSRGSGLFTRIWCWSALLEVALSYIISLIIKRSFDCSDFGHEANGEELYGRFKGFNGVEVDEAFFDLLLQV